MKLMWIEQIAMMSRRRDRKAANFTTYGTIALLLGGCASVQHDQPFKPLVVRGEVSIPRDAACSYTDEYPERKNCCVIAKYVTSENVDQAYDRLMNEFHFTKTPQAYEVAMEATPALDHGHQHLIAPGDAYRLAGIVVPKSDRSLYRGLWLGVDLDRATSSLTTVKAAYCEIGGRAMESQIAWHREVQDLLKATLPPAPGQ